MKGKRKGDVLKGAACYRFSFSKVQKEMLHDFCEQLGLSARSEERAEEIYKTFLKRTLDITITPKSAICGSIYIAAMECGEHRTQQEFMWQQLISSATLRKWWHFVAEVVLDIDWLTIDGRSATYGEIREAIEEAKAKGYEVLPP